MPAAHATGTLGILSSSELDRDLAGVQGTYGWSVQSGAVTFSSGLTFNVAAIAAGDYTVNSVLGALYAGGTVTLTTQDPTNPRVDIIVTTVAGAVSAVAGVAKALNTTSGPVPPTPTSAQLEIARIYVPASGTALSAASITDRRHPLAPSVVYASTTTEATTTSAANTDLVTITGLNIAAGKPFRVKYMLRKTSGAASAANTQIKVNTTAGIISFSTSAANQAELGMVVADFYPGETNYTTGVLAYGWVATAAPAATVAPTFITPSAAMPAATVTSITIVGSTPSAAQTVAVKNVTVEAI